MVKSKLLSLFLALSLLTGMLVSGAGVLAAVLPSGATIGMNDEKLVMTPGTMDYVIGSDSGLADSLGAIYYTDYAKAVTESQQGAEHVTVTNPELCVYTLAADVVGRTTDNFYGRFMGEPVYSTYMNVVPWCYGGMCYKVQGGSYFAQALVINVGVSAAPANDYVFEASTDNGSTWTALTASVSLEFDGTDPLNKTDGKNPQNSVYKAVVQVPGTAEDVVLLRVIMPGADDTHCWPGHNYGFSWYMLGTAVVSAYDLTQYQNLSEVPEFKTPVLKPGIYDDLSTDYYYTKHIRSTWRDADNYNWNTADGYAATYAVTPHTAWGADWPQLLGRLMGQVNTMVIGSFAPWNGTSFIYEVDPNAYIATALVGNTGSMAYVERGAFEVSADKETWQAVTPTVSLETPLEGDKTYFDAYKVVVKIPDGMTYYRITLPGFNRAATNGNEMTYSAGDAEASAQGLSIGGSIASAYDLTQFTDWSQVPDSPLYVDVKKELKEAIVIARAVNLNLYKNDAAKEAFVAALEEADALLESAGSHDENKAMAQKLTDAQAALEPKGVPEDATVGQDDDRRILKPGVADWLYSSAYVDEAGEPVKGGNGVDEWYLCYTDYASTNLVSIQDGRYLVPEQYIHATNYDFFYADTFSAMPFMGGTMGGAFLNTVSWAAANVAYRVYADSYVATAVIVNPALEEAYPAIQNDYVFQVSADGEEWEDVDATLTLLAEDTFRLYKAVVKIPADRYYYRIVMPGATRISPDTTWYAGSPSYEHTFVGPTVASLTDLNTVDTYAELADATAWYADAAVASLDETKLQLTENYFKVIEPGMTVAEALSLVDTTNGTVRFYDAAGTVVEDAATVLTNGMTVDLLDGKGLSMSKHRGTPMLAVAVGNDLLSVGTVEAITLVFGAEKSVEGLTLPTTVPVEAGNGSFDASIHWDVDGCAYDAAVTQTQRFTVTGTVVLPEGVTNNGGVELIVTVEITVEGSTDYGVVSADENKVAVNDEDQILTVQSGMTVAQLKEILTPVGDVYYVVSLGDAEAADEAVVTEEMTVDVYTDVVMLACYSIELTDGVVDEESSAENEDNGNSENSETPGNPDTGVPAMGMLALSVAAVAAGVAAVSVKKRRA